MIRYGTPAARWVLLATALGSGLAFLDSTVVTVALPAIERDLDAGFSGLQWTLDAYLLTLSALLLLGGSLGDVHGRRRVFVVGLTGFTIASVLCGLAPTVGALIGARAAQGVGAALLVPGSLALISAAFHPEDRGRAIGAWAGLSGISTALGPFVGGWLVDQVSWRLVFLINVPLALVVAFAALRHVPESRDPESSGPVDLVGAVTGALGLGGVVFALIEGPVRGWSDGLVVALGGTGIACLIAFVLVERRQDEPMLPPDVFRSRQFSAANAVTLGVYGALSGALFLTVVEMQTNLGYSALEAGAAFVPLTVLLALGSPSAGELCRRVGPRPPMIVGPLVAGAGLWLIAGLQPGDGYLAGLLPGVLIFSVGMTITVAPLTTAAITALADRRAGIASGVNNVVARAAGLLAVAVLPFVAGVPETGITSASFRRALLIAAALCVASAVIAVAVPGRDRIRALAAAPPVPGSPGHDG